MNYTVEHTEEEIIVRISKSENLVSFQPLLDYLEFAAVTAKSQATQEEIDQLAREVNKSWWEQNKKRFIGQEGFEHLGE